MKVQIDDAMYYVQSEMETVLDDDYPDMEDFLACKIMDMFGLSESEVEYVMENWWRSGEQQSYADIARDGRWA
jgi:hypothetical protein